MMPLRCLACLVFLSGSLLPLPAATSLVNLASEKSPIILTVHDVPGLLAQWDQSPWAKTWNDEQVKRFFAPLRAKWKVDEWSASSRDKTGYTVNELLALATGDAIVVVSDLDFTSSKTPAILVAIEVGDNASKIEEVIAKQNKEGKETEEVSDFSGVAVHLSHAAEKAEDKDPRTTVWAMVEGKFLISFSKEIVLAAIDGVKSGGVANPWGKSDRFAQLQQRTGETHVSLVVNVEAIYPAIKSAMEAKKKANPEQSTGPLSMDPQAMLPALGIDTWRDFYASVRLRDDSTEMRGGLTYSEARGIVKLLAYHDGPPQTPAFVSSKWVSVSTSKYSLKETFAAVEEILENFSPAISGLAQGQLRAANKSLGIDLKRDLIGSVGDTFVAANTISPKAQAAAQPSFADFEQLFALSLDNQDVFTNAIEAVKRSLGLQADTLFTTRDYLGQKIFTFKSPGPAQPKGVSYTIAKGYFFVSVGSAAPIEAALQGLTGKQPNIWEKPEVSAAFAQLPPNAVAFQYQDIRAMIGSLFKTLSTAATMMNHPGMQLPGAPTPEPAEDDTATVPTKAAAAALMIDPNALPDTATLAKYWSHSWGYATKESTGIHGSSQIVYPK